MVAAGGTNGGAPAAPYAYAGAQRSRATSPTRIAGSASSQPATASSARRRGAAWRSAVGVRVVEQRAAVRQPRAEAVAVAPAYARAAAVISAARTRRARRSAAVRPPGRR